MLFFLLLKSNPMREENYFRSSELSLVATLQLYGYDIKAIDRDETNKATFCINRDEKLNDIVSAFWSKRLQVSPLSYFEALKSVKSRLYQQS